MMNPPAPPLAVLYGAWRSARSRKKPSMNMLAFEADWLGRLLAIQEVLAERRWQPQRSVCFVTTHPKTREIHAPDFADRVVHHYLVPQLQAIYEPVFIHDSYANRSGKGSHQAVARLQQFMRQVEGKPAFFLQLDIHNFFNSINRHILYRQLGASALPRPSARARSLPINTMRSKPSAMPW
jgi:RNA-directed DNA polymerase